MTQALREAKKRRGKKEFAFNELLLKFGTMASGFIKAREYFTAMDLNKDKLIDLEEFITMVRMRVVREVFFAALRFWCCCVCAAPVTASKTHQYAAAIQKR
jgi:hypothetical protein